MRAMWYMDMVPVDLIDNTSLLEQVMAWCYDIKP